MHIRVRLNQRLVASSFRGYRLPAKLESRFCRCARCRCLHADLHLLDASAFLGAAFLMAKHGEGCTHLPDPVQPRPMGGSRNFLPDLLHPSPSSADVCLRQITNRHAEANNFCHSRPYMVILMPRHYCALVLVSKPKNVSLNSEPKNIRIPKELCGES